MLITILIFIPVILAAIWTAKRSLERHMYYTAVCIPLFSFLLIFHYFRITEFWYYGIHGITILGTVDNWLYPFIIPTFYVLLSSKVAGGRSVLNGLSMLALAVLNFTAGLTINLKGGPAVINEGAFLVTIAWGGKSIANIPVHQMVLISQSLWLITRLYNYNKIMKKENTHLSDGMRTIAKYVILTISVALITSLLPVPEPYIPGTLFILNHIPISIGFAYVIYLIGKGYMINPIVDENNEQAVSTINESKENLFLRVVSYMKSSRCYLKTDLLLVDLAEAVHTNRAFLSETIMKMTDDNFSAYINSYRVRKAKQLIIDHPEIKMDDVATQCGFNSNSSFTKTFKKHTGLTPTEMRAKIRRTPKSRMMFL